MYFLSVSYLLVIFIDLKKWKETLALLSSYTVSENFAYLCQELGSRLMNEGKSVQFDEPGQS